MHGVEAVIDKDLSAALLATELRADRLLLLTDDGQFIHRMSSPRHHVPKVYEVTTDEPLDDKQVQRLLDGVYALLIVR